MMYDGSRGSSGEATAGEIGALEGVISAATALAEQAKSEAATALLRRALGLLRNRGGVRQAGAGDPSVENTIP